MLSSLYQETHRVGFGAGTPDGRNDTIPEEAELVQEILQREGWHTVAVTGGGYMAGVFGFERGFDQFRDGSPSILVGSSRLLKYLKNRPDKPVFALLHTYEVHSPYEPPAEYGALWDTYDSDVAATNEVLKPIQKGADKVLEREDFDRLEALYDGELRYTDDTLRSFFAELEAIGFLDNALVIITADHGEEFGDHGGLLHGMTLFEELLHVPLIVVGTGVAEATVNPHLVSMIDLAPTILAAAGVPVGKTMEGRSLLDDIRAEPWHQQRIFAQYADFQYCIRTPRWKLVQYPRGGRLQLFDLQKDPLEQHNVRRDNRKLSKLLLAELEAWKSGRPSIVGDRSAQEELSPDKVEELRALGYVD